MSRVTDILTVAAIARHCTNPRCQKCAARDRWNRRKGWRAPKSLRKNNRTNRERG